MRISVLPEVARVLLVLAVGAGSAAASSFYVSTNAQSNYRTATGASLSYNSVTGATQSISNDGSQTETYSGTPNILGLTSSFDQSSFSQGTTYGTVTGSAYAAADLSSGSVHAAASGSSTIINGPFGVGATLAQLSDTLTFTILGAGPTTVTDITVTYTLDGTDSYVAFAQYNQADSLFFGAASASFSSDTAPTWASANFISSSPNDGVFQGVYALVGATVVVPLTLSLVVDCEDGCSADFSNTGLIGLSLPSNVSFTSASGVFLTASTPEPSSWAMMLIGGAGVMIGLARRRRGADEPCAGRSRHR
jgi:hypothetical protein